MARIRTIKPEFWSDEKLSLLDPLTRLVYLGLISQSDDGGRLVDNVKQIDGMLFPSTDDSCGDSLVTLARLSRILRYVAPSGQHLIQIVNWHHQKIAHPSAYVLPAPTPDDFSQAVGTQGDTSSLAQVSRNARETRVNVSRDAHDSINDLVSTTNDLHPRLPSRELTADEGSVLEHYRLRHPRRRPTEADARKYIAPALKRYSVDELNRAIDGNADDEWHVQRAKHELSYVLRQEKIDGFIALIDCKPKPRIYSGALSPEDFKRLSA